MMMLSWQHFFMISDIYFSRAFHLSHPFSQLFRVLVYSSNVLFSAFEKALLYFDGCELPINWNREELLGPEEDDGNEGDEVSCQACRGIDFLRTLFGATILVAREQRKTL